MIEGIEPFYRQIAESIQEVIPEEWTEAKIEAVFYADGSSYEGEYTRKTDGVSRSFPTKLEGERAFREIRKLFEKAGKPLWGKACFLLQSDGKFNMEWSYDNCDVDGNYIFDEETELRRSEERHKRLTSN